MTYVPDRINLERCCDTLIEELRGLGKGIVNLIIHRRMGRLLDEGRT
jgi:hypothetical protein